MALSSPGIGSGLDVRSIVSQLVALERRPIEQLQTQKTKLDTRLSSFGLLQSYVSNLQAIAGQIGSAAFWSRVSASSSDASAVSVVAPNASSTASYSVNVTTLAVAQSLSTAAGAITDANDIGSGTLTITRGGTPVALTIAPGTSLAGLRDQINAGAAGVKAAIVQDSGGPRLVFTASETGTDNAVSVTATGATGQLATLTYPGTMTQDRPAANAVLSINGLQITSASNKLTNVVDGLTLTLSKATTEPVTVSVGPDTVALRKGITDFVSAYNEVNKYLANETKYDEGKKVAGALQGDRAAVGLQGRLRSLQQETSPA